MNTTIDTHVTLVRPGPGVQPIWLGFSLFPLQMMFEDMGEGATNQKELKRSRMADLSFLVPTQKQQTDFDCVVQPHVAMIQTLHEQNQKLARTRDLLLPRLMSGELEP